LREEEIELSVRSVCFVLATLSGVGCLSVAETSPGVLQTNICEIRLHPERFLGKRVSFHAQVMSDGIERTVLIDGNPECKLGLTPLTIEGDADSERAADKLSAAIFQGHPGTLDKRIEADFVGIFSMQKPETVGMSSAFKDVGVIRVQSVENLKISQLELPSPSR
jgi:hypothetical protein